MRFKIQNSTFKIAIAIAVAIVTTWGGHIYAQTPPTTPECPPTTPASARSCRVQKRSFCLPEQFKIQNPPFQITADTGGSPIHEHSCNPRRCPQVRTLRSLPLGIGVPVCHFIGGAKTLLESSVRYNYRLQRWSSHNRSGYIGISRMVCFLPCLPELSERSEHGWSIDACMEPCRRICDTIPYLRHVGRWFKRSVSAQQKRGIRKMEYLGQNCNLADHLTGKEVTSHV